MRQMGGGYNKIGENRRWFRRNRGAIGSQIPPEIPPEIPPKLADPPLKTTRSVKTVSGMSCWGRRSRWLQRQAKAPNRIKVGPGSPGGPKKVVQLGNSERQQPRSSKLRGALEVTPKKPQKRHIGRPVINCESSAGKIGVSISMV